VLDAAVICLALFAALHIARSFWKEILRSRRRREAIADAARQLPRSEQIDWFNRTGRYKDAGAIPRTFAPHAMTADEYRRYSSRSGEFAER
jgi:hypothetical protein